MWLPVVTMRHKLSQTPPLHTCQAPWNPPHFHGCGIPPSSYHVQSHIRIQLWRINKASRSRSLLVLCFLSFPSPPCECLLPYLLLLHWPLLTVIVENAMSNITQDIELVVNSTSVILAETQEQFRIETEQQCVMSACYVNEWLTVFLLTGLAPTGIWQMWVISNEFHPLSLIPPDFGSIVRGLRCYYNSSLGPHYHVCRWGVFSGSRIVHRGLSRAVGEACLGRRVRPWWEFWAYIRFPVDRLLCVYLF